ncbi:MAG TPA: sugar ABC transporter ATP-binding protein [Terriglobia bacterium]|nr:sugar ABC transporter ATP-binding protein [Terriglobia bacterium]
MSRELIRLDHIGKSFAGVNALKDISLTLHSGKIYCLVGENGSGKSTLIKVIAGIHQPDSGEIAFHGKVLHQFHPIEAIRQGIQVIYQDLSLFPNLTVAENLAINHLISRKRHWVWRREVRKIAVDALRKIKANLNLDARLGTLPVADRQLIAIARALLQNARLIIMDEPTTALTRNEVNILQGVIRNLKEDGISILFVSHKIDEVMEIGEHIIILRNGEKVVDRATTDLDRSSVVQAMTGRDVKPKGITFPRVAQGAPALLKVESLSCAGLFCDVSFELRVGEIVGITGLLGSGRTGLALSLFGICPANSGTLTLEGVPLKVNRIRDALANGIAYVPEDRLTEGLFLTRSIGENIAVRIVDSLVSRIHLLDHQAIQSRIREWVARLKIRASSTNLPVSSLSGGNQQRAVLARWLASNPRVLILNGPTAGIDVGSKAEIHEIVRDLAKSGIGILVISDDIPELLEVCHRILLMKRGRIAAEFERPSITEARLSEILVSA